jgi:hypothetical protein
MVEARGAVLLEDDRGLAGTSTVCLRLDRFVLGVGDTTGVTVVLSSLLSLLLLDAFDRLTAGLFAPAAADWRLGAGLFDLAA